MKNKTRKQTPQQFNVTKYNDDHKYHTYTGCGNMKCFPQKRSSVDKNKQQKRKKY